jgi:predicted PurR-regulated permease PerM
MFKKLTSRNMAALFTFFYLGILIIMGFSSASIAIISFGIIGIVLLLEPWNRFLSEKLKIRKGFSISIAFAIIIVIISLVIFFLIPVIFREATNLYNLSMDFFPADQNTNITSFEINNNISKVLSEDDFVKNLSDSEKSNIELLKSDLKDYYSKLDFHDDGKETLDNILQNYPQNNIVIIYPENEANYSLEAIEKITGKYLSSENSAYISSKIYGSALNTNSKELWKDAAEYFIPSSISNERKDQMMKTIKDILNQLKDFVRTNIPHWLEKIPNFLGTTVYIVFFIILGAIYLSYYFGGFKKFIPLIYPKKCRNEAIPFLKDTYISLERYLISIIICALIVGFSMGISFELLGLPFALLVGFWAAITNLIPVIGVVFEVVPVLLLALYSKSWFDFIILVIIIIFLHAFAFILFLKISQGLNKVNPFFIIIMMVLMSQLFGFAGSFIAVPACLVIKRIWEHFLGPWMEDH